MDAIYVRQSRFKEESLSIETQIELCRKVAKGDAKVYNDAGISGKDITHRPAFRQMLRDIQENLIDRVIVYKLDRFSRSLLDFANTWEILNEHDTAFVSVTEQFDTSTPIGKACLFLLALFAQMEREQIALRVTDNYYARAKLGRWAGGPAPFGYDLGKMETRDGKVSTLKRNVSADVVKEIFDSYMDPLTSLGSIQRDLNERGIKTAAGKNWTNVALARLLRNPAYVKCDASIYAHYREMGVDMANQIDKFTGEYGGLLVGKRAASGTTRGRKKPQDMKFSVGNWPAFIDAPVWLLCQRKLCGNSQLKRDGAGKNSWLTGLVKCGYCGYAMYVMKYERKNGITRYFNCSGKYKGYCERESAPCLEVAEQQVGRELIRVLEGQKGGNTSVSVPVRENEIQMEIIKVEEQIRNLISTIKDGRMTQTSIFYINEAIEELAQRERELCDRLKQEREKMAKEILKDIDFEELSFTEKKIVAMTYVERIKIFSDRLEIEWKV